MYQIYYSREKHKIYVSKMLKVFEDGKSTQEYIKDVNNNPGKVINYNGCYSFSTSKKALIKFGLELKEKWINELKDEIAQFELIDI